MDRAAFDLSLLPEQKDLLTEQSYQNLLAARGYAGLGLGIDRVAMPHTKQGGIRVRGFHRNAIEGIDLITINVWCSLLDYSEDSEDQLRFYDMSAHGKTLREYLKNVEAMQKNGEGINKPVHRVYPGADFMQRVDVYKEENKGSSFFEYFKQNINKPHQ